MHKTAYIYGNPEINQWGITLEKESIPKDAPWTQEGFLALRTTDIDSQGKTTLPSGKTAYLSMVNESNGLPYAMFVSEDGEKDFSHVHYYPPYSSSESFFVDVGYGIQSNPSYEKPEIAKKRICEIMQHANIDVTEKEVALRETAPFFPGIYPEKLQDGFILPSLSDDSTVKLIPYLAKSEGWYSSSGFLPVPSAVTEVSDAPSYENVLMSLERLSSIYHHKPEDISLPIDIRMDKKLISEAFPDGIDKKDLSNYLVLIDEQKNKQLIKRTPYKEQCQMFTAYKDAMALLLKTDNNKIYPLRMPTIEDEIKAAQRLLARNFHPNIVRHAILERSPLCPTEERVNTIVNLACRSIKQTHHMHMDNAR